MCSESLETQREVNVQVTHTAFGFGLRFQVGVFVAQGSGFCLVFEAHSDVSSSWGRHARPLLEPLERFDGRALLDAFVPTRP
eukprot:3859067-Amphidinium_carterae.1